MKFLDIYNFYIMLNIKNIKLFIILFIIICISAGYYYISNKEITFLYLNPYTETSGFPSIARTIKELNNAFEFTQKNSKAEGNDFKYIFKNAYGSGFLKNNPIPNDLDFAVGIYLGEYNFDKNSAEDIANSVVNKMDSFQYFFNSYVNTLQDSTLYIDQTAFQVLENTSSIHAKNTKDIATYLPTVLEGKDYVKYTQKTMDGTRNSEKVELPYFLKSNEILIENYSPINLFSDEVFYNKNMPRYIRTISIIPEFFVKIKTKDKSVMVEIVPEAFLGERLQLSRRFFASTVFIDLASEKFLNNLSYINDDEEYLYYRMFSYRRHLQEISNLKLIKDRPVKMLKRIMQTADIISPAIDIDTYDEISKVIQENLSNRDIQLLNEYSNICTTLYQIAESPQLFLHLKGQHKIKIMYDTMTKCLNELDSRGNIDKKVIANLRKIQTQQLQKMFLIRTESEVIKFRALLFTKTIVIIQNTINQTIFENLLDKDKLNSYIALFNKIYTDAGYHKVSLYWLNQNTMGILKDDFTQEIKDYNKFAKDNDLSNVEYKLLSQDQTPKSAIKYSVWARNNANTIEENNYQNLRNALLKDKKNFKIKRKFVFIN